MSNPQCNVFVYDERGTMIDWVTQTVTDEKSVDTFVECTEHRIPEEGSSYEAVVMVTDGEGRTRRVGVLELGVPKRCRKPQPMVKFDDRKLKDVIVDELTRPQPLVTLASLTDEQRALALDAIVHAWHGIAGDVFEGRRHMGEHGPMKRAAVLEVTLDCQRPLDSLRELCGWKKSNVDPTLVAFFGYRHGQYDEQHKAALIALPQRDWL